MDHADNQKRYPATDRTSPDGVRLAEIPVNIVTAKDKFECLADIFLNYQRNGSLWLEVPASNRIGPPGTEVSITNHQTIPFKGEVTGLAGLIGETGPLQMRLIIEATLEPLDCKRQSSLRKVQFALLDCPFPGPRTTQRGGWIVEPVTLNVGGFKIILGHPTASHEALMKELGRRPRTLTHSGIITHHTGEDFDSEAAKVILDAICNSLSFAAGRWLGMTAVEGLDDNNQLRWFRWGVTRMNSSQASMGFHRDGDANALANILEGFLTLKPGDEQDTIQTALYWYFRSNSTGAGVDGSIILSQCALELLSWWVIVRREMALTESGFGQLASSAERLRLMLKLLGIPSAIPATLRSLVAFAKSEQWLDIADATTEGRNYLVHPTAVKKGTRRKKKDMPWQELWQAAQWTLELTLLRLLSYNGHYLNRTKRTKLQDLPTSFEPVPWKSAG
ncbi:MAG: hypothetical protein U0R19_37585 [Bryobacteraceae bacterium]